jgi:hypothetical protein
VTARAGQAEDELGVGWGELWPFKRERQPAALMEERLGVFLRFFAVRACGWVGRVGSARVGTYLGLQFGRWVHRGSQDRASLSRCRGRCHERF